MAAPYSLYVDLPLRQMRASYDDLGLHGLSNTILELEGTHAVSQNTSRILDSGDYRGNAEFLLSQIPEGMLTSILSNTLPADVASRRPILEQWSTISLHPQHKDTLEPGIYANYLAPRDGSALSLVEFQQFLEGLEAAVSGTLMNGTNVGDEVDNYYRREFRRPALLPEIKGRNLRAALNTFLQVNTARLQDAQLQNATHITIHGDCGWAINIHDRCQEHKNLVNSPALFRLANCVLRVLFPLKDFMMHHFCLFRVVKTEQAGIGESIGSHLVTSYSTYGGFNFAQAGISVTSAKQLTGNGSMTVCDRNSGMLRKVTTRLEDAHKDLYAEVEQAEAEVQRRREHQALVQQRAEIEQLKKQVAQGDTELDTALVGMLDSMKRIMSTPPRDSTQEAIEDVQRSANMRRHLSQARYQGIVKALHLLRDLTPNSRHSQREQRTSGRHSRRQFSCSRVEQVQPGSASFPGPLHGGGERGCFAGSPLVTADEMLDGTIFASACRTLFKTKLSVNPTSVLVPILVAVSVSCARDLSPSGHQV
ncbi:hypothetical protein KCU64_g173, partial [Aureobasidium melanogenum]